MATETASLPIGDRQSRSTSAQGSAGRRVRGRNWPLLFALGYIAFQVSLLFLGSTPLRTPLRIGAYAISLVMTALLRPGKTGRHPALAAVPFVFISLAIGLVIPGQSSPIAAIAQVTLYVAVLSPLIWVSHSPLKLIHFRNVIITLWTFNVLSATVGVLQVYYPGMFQGQMAAVVLERGAAYLGSMTIELANGARAFRPMGLTDAPGGAAVGGSFAILFGTGLLFTERGLLLRALSLAGMVVGLFVIYLTQVRVSLVIVVVGMFAILVTFSLRGDGRRAAVLIIVMLSVALAGTAWAFAVGGNQTITRFSSLLESHPADVYSQNRGLFLQDAFSTQLFDHPLGQGVGRWGMIGFYFGGDAQNLWAEIMWQGWLYDGGILLMLSYCSVILLAVYAVWKMALNRTGGLLAVWAGIVFAYDLSMIAGTFDYPVFNTQGGLEMWLINACLFNAWFHRSGSVRPKVVGDLEKPAGSPAH